MLLTELLKGIEHEALQGSTNCQISGISLDSRQVKPGFLFVAKKGAVADGSFYIADAAERGASAIVVAEPPKLPPKGVTIIRLEESKENLAQLAHRFYGQPRCRLIGLTGTNGKTTSAYAVRNLLAAGGRKIGLIGTIANEIGERRRPASRTTPDVFELYALLNFMDQEGAEAVVMEVSSHAAAQNRIGLLRYDAMVFTNLTQDHLDYHNTMEEYYAAKRSFFEHGKEDATSYVMVDDEWGRRLASELGELGRKVVTMSAAGQPADLSAEKISVGREGSRFTLRGLDSKTREVAINYLGRHNVANVMGALAIARDLGESPDDLVERCRALPQVPGRLEFMPNKLGLVVVIDYAHTDDAMRNVMKCLREITEGQLWIVFGCGGDRDRTKRPKMGRAAEEMADRVVITTDNPRTEDPQKIVEDILEGMKSKDQTVILDRKEAITYAIREARPGDVVLLAGKGHETYQEINRVFYDCDERLITREIIGKIENA